MVWDRHVTVREVPPGPARRRRWSRSSDSPKTLSHSSSPRSTTGRCTSSRKARRPSASCWCSITANRSASCATSRSQSHTNARGSGRPCSPTCATAEAARGTARLLVGTSSADTGQPRLLPAVRLPVALDRTRLLHPGPRVSARLRAQRAVRRRHGLDGSQRETSTPDGPAPRHRARCHAAARVARVPPAVGGRGHHRGRIAVHPCRGGVPGVRADRIDADGRPARARHDGAALLRFAPRRRSRRSLRATPRDPADAGRRFALRARARAERRCTQPADLDHLRRLLPGTERLRDPVYRRAGRQCRCSCNPSTSLRRQHSRRCSAAPRC